MPKARKSEPIDWKSTNSEAKGANSEGSFRKYFHIYIGKY